LGVPRQTVAPPRGTEWPKGTVDAPDYYYSAARVRLSGRTVTVYDQHWKQQGVYELDREFPVVSGTLAGLVDGMPFTVTNGCNCGDSFVKAPKGHDMEGEDR
jgi:hypothetical protein